MRKTYLVAGCDPSNSSFSSSSVAGSIQVSALFFLYILITCVLVFHKQHQQQQYCRTQHITFSRNSKLIARQLRQLLGHTI